MRVFDCSSHRSDWFATGRFNRPIRLALAFACTFLIGLPGFAETPAEG